MNCSPGEVLPKFSKLRRKDKGFIAYNRLEKKNKNLPEVLFLGGFRSDMMGIKALFLDSLCEKRNQTFTRFDYFGHGLSSGSFTEGTIGQWLSDALAIIDETTQGPLILIGSSMGGWLMTLAALKRPDRIKGLIGIASAPDFTEELIWPALTDIQRKEFLRHGILYAPSEQEGGELPITLQLIEEARQHLVLSKPIDIHCPAHFIHGSADKVVPWQLSQRLTRRIKSDDISLTLIKNGDHRLNTPLALGRVASLLDETSQEIMN